MTGNHNITNKEWVRAISGAEAALSDTTALWRVTVTNGSGTKTVDVRGTQAYAWKWAELAAHYGAFGAGAWAPADIKAVGPDDGAPFAVAGGEL